MCVFTLSFAQFDHKNAFEISRDYGLSNDLGPGETYRTFISDYIIIDKKTSAKTKNIEASYTRYINSFNGIKFSVGLSKYGFDYEGVTMISNTQMEGSIRVRYLEFGISYLARIPIFQNTKLLIEPGLRYHLDESSTSSSIVFRRSNAFSASIFSGLEFLMIGENIFTIVGLQLKLPLQKYNDTLSPTTPPIYPFFIGLKIGIKYQF